MSLMHLIITIRLVVRTLYYRCSWKGLAYVDTHCNPTMHFSYREVFLSLRCDPSAKEPILTTTGDISKPLSYVCSCISE